MLLSEEAYCLYMFGNSSFMEMCLIITCKIERPHSINKQNMWSLNCCISNCFYFKIKNSFLLNILWFNYIYIYAFSRRFYPKRLTLHSSYSFYILSALAFPGNRTHDLGVASAMLYQLSYRKANYQLFINFQTPCSSFTIPSLGNPDNVKLIALYVVDNK